MTDEADANQDLRVQPGWWARLEGEQLDLEALAHALGDPMTVQVAHLDGRYYVRMPEFDQIDEPSAIETLAKEVLRVANGATRIQHADHREVQVDGVVCVHPSGQIQNFIHASSSFNMRDRISVFGHSGPAGGAQVIAQRALATALQDAQAERALRIFGRDDGDYRDMYHVFEIAEGAFGNGIYLDGTVTRAEVRRFKHTANSVHALGDQARHGHETTQPPVQPMSFAEARGLIGRVLRVWLAP